MHVADRRFGWGSRGRVVTLEALGQLDPASLVASVPEVPAEGIAASGFGYYKLAVGAGITVWLLTKVFDEAFFKKKRR
jgi:hypothetical protein